MRNIAIFASGSGTNTENIISHFLSSDKVSVSSVYCNSQTAAVLGKAEKYGIRTHVFSKAELSVPGLILSTLKEEETDLIVLAGFMLLLPEEITEAYRYRILNVHPSLIPKYCGKGMYGGHVHQAVVDAGEKESGITIHFVDDKYDEGDIILQARCRLSPQDSAEDVAAKVHALEYRYYPQVIEQIIDTL